MALHIATPAELREQNVNSLDAARLATIQEDIAAAISAGQHQVTSFAPLTREMRAALAFSGYTIRQQVGINHNLITW